MLEGEPAEPYQRPEALEGKGRVHCKNGNGALTNLGAVTVKVRIADRIPPPSFVGPQGKAAGGTIDMEQKERTTTSERRLRWRLSSDIPPEHFPGPSYSLRKSPSSCKLKEKISTGQSHPKSIAPDIIQTASSGDEATAEGDRPVQKRKETGNMGRES